MQSNHVPVYASASSFMLICTCHGVCIARVKDALQECMFALQETHNSEMHSYIINPLVIHEGG